MKLISIAIIEDNKILKSHIIDDLPWFGRKNIIELINETSLVLSSQGKNITATIQSYECTVIYSKCIVAVTADNEYPHSVIYKLASSITRDSDLKKIFDEYQDPLSVDKVLKIQKELDEITAIMKVNLDTIISRGESLQDLLIKSESMSLQSKAFLKETEKLNSCCIII